MATFGPMKIYREIPFLDRPVHEGREVPSRRLEGRQSVYDGILSARYRAGISPDRLPEPIDHGDLTLGEGDPPGRDGGRPHGLIRLGSGPAPGWAGVWVRCVSPWIASYTSRRWRLTSLGSRTPAAPCRPGSR